MDIQRFCRHKDKKTILITGFLIGLFLLLLVFVFMLSSAPGGDEDFTLPASFGDPASSCPPDFDPLPLLLISLDGFSPVYLERGVTPTIKMMMERGSWAPYMTSSFPTLTFPNHYTIVTGLYPESHGIVSNSFYDPVFRTRFSYKNPNSKEGRWWGGEPIWHTLKRNNMSSATYFWPGSEAPIQGHQPTFWYKYSKTPHILKRIQKVFDWLNLPKAERPSWIAIYDSEPDSTGHKYGPSSPKVTEKIQEADTIIAYILKGLSSRNLLSCVNILVVSDHGMSSGGASKVIHLEELLPTEAADKISFSPGASPRISIKYKYKAYAEELEASLSCKRSDLKVFRTKDLPKRLHYSNNRRIGDYVLVLDDGASVNLNSNFSLEGLHGYDNIEASMRALFVAYGPSFKENFQMEPFQNIELYNLMCHLLGVEPAPNNGTNGLLYAILKHPPEVSVEEEPGVKSLKFPTEEELQRNRNSSNCTATDDATFEEVLRLLNVSEKAKEIRSRAVPWGAPESQSSHETVLLLHKRHLTGYSPTLRVPLWTSFTTQEVPKRKSTASSFQWTSDPRLDEAEAPGCPANHSLPRSTSIQFAPLFPPEFRDEGSVNATTELVSNGAFFSNFSLWHTRRLLLDLIPKWANKTPGSLNIILGPIFDRDSDGRMDELSARNSEVVVPTDFFTIVIKCISNWKDLNKCPEDHLDVLAFIYPQKLNAPVCFSSEEEFALFFSAKIRDVEALTGLKFFTALGPSKRLSLVAKEINHLW